MLRKYIEITKGTRHTLHLAALKEKYKLTPMVDLSHTLLKRF
jgi:hypothetical protein